MPVAVRRAAVAEQHRHLVQAFGRATPEIPHHLRRLHVGLRIALLGVHKIGELDGILDEEHRRVVADQIPVALLGVEANGESARVAFRVRRAFLAPHGREAHEGLDLPADLLEESRVRVARDVVRHGEAAVRPRPLGMCHTLRDALTVEVLQLLDQMEVLQQQRAAGPGGE